MARIELKHCTVRFRDGFAGSALVDDTAIADQDTTLEIDTLSGLPDSMTTVPVGVRFTIDSVSDTVFTVTGSKANEQQEVSVSGATAGTFTLTLGGEETAVIDYDATAPEVQAALEALPSVEVGDVVVTGGPGPDTAWIVEFQGQFAGADVGLMTIDGTGLTDGTPLVSELHAGGTTWQLSFTPALQAGDLPSDDDAITFLPQQIDIKIGDGNLTYTENKNYEYELDRGQLDTVREGDEAPMDVNIDFVYEFVTTGTNEAITPMDSLKRQGGASTWVSASSDPCEPYCVDIEVEHIPPCGGAEKEITLFPEFRPDSKEVDLGEAAISVSGRCNATEPTVTRESQ